MDRTIQFLSTYYNAIRIPLNIGYIKLHTTKHDTNNAITYKELKQLPYDNLYTKDVCDMSCMPILILCGHTNIAIVG